MAAVIHELWMSQDASPMIMPGSFPLDVAGVRDELTRYLDEGWNAVVDTEVDGKQPIPYHNDQDNHRYGRLLASRRVARTILLGSAPDVNAQSQRGLETAHIRLGVVQPNENIAFFNDALGTLRISSSYLYSDGNGNRYWYDTRPTLRKTVEDRAQRISDDEACYEIEKRLGKTCHKESPFQGLHVCPSSSLDIPDEQSLRLVVLPPRMSHRGNSVDSEASSKVADWLQNRGTASRVYKNMLVFVVPDASTIGPLLEETKRYLAWCSIDGDREALNLDATQNRETRNSIRRCNSSVELRMEETWCWLFAPHIDLASGDMKIEWDIEHISGGSEGIVHKAARKLLSDEAAVERWAPALLRMELDNKHLWRDRDDIQIKQLWDYLCTYCYLSRLASYSVLEDAIKQGLAAQDYFAIAGGVGDNGYLDLRFGEPVAYVNPSDFLVKPDVAKAQLAHEAEERRQAEEKSVSNGTTTTGSVESGQHSTTGNGRYASITNGSGLAQGDNQPASLPTCFRMSAPIDRVHINCDVMNIVNEIVSNLESVDGCDLEITLDVCAVAADGFAVPTQRAISENCNTLHIGDYGFNG